MDLENQPNLIPEGSCDPLMHLSKEWGLWYDGCVSGWDEIQMDKEVEEGQRPVRDLMADYGYWGPK